MSFTLEMIIGNRMFPNFFYYVSIFAISRIESIWLGKNNYNLKLKRRIIIIW